MSTAKENGFSSAFPVPNEALQDGLTKREYFAAMAMWGYNANPQHAMTNFSKIAEWSVNDADALLKALAESEVKP
jgi:hypothetical protein